MCEEVRTYADPAPSQQFNGSHGGGGSVSEGRIRFIQKFCISALVMKMEDEGLSAKEAAQRMAEHGKKKGNRDYVKRRCVKEDG